MPNPLKEPSDIDQLVEEGAVSKLLYVGQAITLTRHKIEGNVPLIGFAGAPVSILIFFIFFSLMFILEIGMVTNA